MKICLVTAFPPSREALNEYGFHVASELKNVPGISLTILGDDDFPAGEPETEGFNVVRCWAFNRLDNGRRLLRAIRSLEPDLVWFNLGFASFGGKPLTAFLGICIPARIRLAGYYTHVTLHQLMETVDLQDAGVKFPWMYRLGGFLGTQMLLFANSVSVMMPAYRDILRRKYRRGAVYVRRHGTLAARPEYPDFSRRGNPQHRILAFGKWGTYKRLELLIESFSTVVRQVPNAELIVAGTDHPKTPGYLKQMADECAHQPQIKFIGYVAEEDVPALFQTSTLTAMPYHSSAGSSGIAHLACAYGVPMVASDLPDFRRLAEEEGLAMEYFEVGNAQALAERLLAILENPEHQMEMALQNVSAALRMSMPEVVRQYLENFQLRQQLDQLEQVARLRKLPRWVPLRDRLLGRSSRKLFRPQSPEPSPEGDGFPLVHGDPDLGGGVLAAGITVDHEGIGMLGGVDGSGLGSAAQPAAASAEHSRSQDDSTQ
jgi:glycosyltransferase involved in cell wall biosynthesis